MEYCYNHSLVSIIITTHNRAELLPRAIDSALKQTHQNFEIIIVNDGSSDNTDQIVHKYMKSYSNIRYIKHEECRGGNAARNSGIMAAKGEFIAGLDDDDEFLPDRISRLLINYTEECSLIASRSIEIRKNKSRGYTRYIPIVELNDMLYFNVIGNQVLAKKKIFISSGLFDESLTRWQDYDMWIRIIAKYGKAKMIKDITQIIHSEHDGHSNNILPRNVSGAINFYNKHSEIMNAFQKRMKINRIAEFENKMNFFFKVERVFILTIVNVLYIFKRAKYMFV